MAFDPDAYLNKSSAKPSMGGFDPDAYLNKSLSPGDELPAKVTQAPTLGDYAQTVVPTIKALGKNMFDTAGEMSRGAISGASFDTAGKLGFEEQAAEDSFMNAQGQPKGSIEKYASPRNIGKAVGSVIPIIASEFAAGIAVPALIAKYGLGAFKAAVTSGALTGMVYGGLKGSVRGTPPLETAGGMATDALAFGALGAGGYGAGKAREALSRELPSYMANLYANAPKRIADSQLEKRAPDVGELMLNQPEIAGFTRRKTAYKRLNSELENGDIVIDFTLDNLADKAKMRNAPLESRGVSKGPVPESRQLEYKPTEVQNVSPGPDYQFPQMRDRRIPGGASTTTGRKTSEPDLAVLPTKNLESRDPNVDFYSRTDSPRVGKGTSNFDGRLATPENIGDNMAGATDRRWFETRDPSKMAAPIKQGPNIDLGEVVKNLDSQINTYKVGRSPDVNRISALEEVRNNFINSGDQIVNIKDAVNILRTLNNAVGKAYESTGDAKLSALIEAQESLAGALRGQISKTAPEVSGLLHRQHNLLLQQRSLAGSVSGRGLSSNQGGVLERGLRNVAEGPATLGTANLLRKGLGEPSAIAAPIGRQTTRLGLSEMIDSIRQKGKQ